jgi:hypothetical protein
MIKGLLHSLRFGLEECRVINATCPSHTETIIHTKLQVDQSYCTFVTMATDQGKWKFNHTMLRVKDPQRSLEYYKFLGLSQINKMSNPDSKFDLYFLGMWVRRLEGAAPGP